MKTCQMLSIAAVLATLSLGETLRADLYFNGTLKLGASITLDGNASDWDSSYIIATDPNEDYLAEAMNLENVYMANDAHYLYLAFTRYSTLALPNNGNGYMSIVIDGDNNSTTGSNYDGSGNFDMLGASIVAIYHMTINDRISTLNVTDGSGGWISKIGDTTFGFEYSASNSIVEIKIALSDIADLYDGSTLAMKVVQNYQGDSIIGTTWNVGITPITYDVVIPEPATLTLLGIGGVGLNFIKRRKA